MNHLNATSFLSITLLFLFSCLHCYAQSVITPDSVFSGYLPTLIKYDTIDVDFLYECTSSAYIEGGDEIVKGNDFIRFHAEKEKLYEDGIFTNLNFGFKYENAKKKNALVHYDVASVNGALREIYYKCIIEEGDNVELQLNPICESFYRKVHLKIEVLDLGPVLQRIPLRMGCFKAQKYNNKHNGQAYEILPIETYVITKVFQYKIM